MNERYDGPERRENDRALSALKMELAQVRASVDSAVEDLVTQESLNRTAKRAAKRLSASYIIAAISIGLVGSLLYSNQQHIKQVARDARRSAATLQDCLIVGGGCYSELATRGSQGQVRSVKFQACVLREPIPDRSAERIIGCARKAYPDVSNIEEQLREVLK